MQNNEFSAVPMKAANNGLQSESVGNIAKALADAQATFTFAGKGSEAVGQGGQKRRYADLQSVLEAVRQGLSQNGIALCQQAEPSESGFSVRTVLLHESGEWLASVLPIPDALWRNPPVDASGRPRSFNPMQQLGSCITYARRYALSALAGISQDDDDGESLRQAPAPMEAPHGPVDGRNAQNRPQGRGTAQNAGEGRTAPETRLRKAPPIQPTYEGDAPADLPDDAPASKQEVFDLIKWLCFKGINNRKDQQEFVAHQCGFDPQGWDFRQLTVGHLRTLRKIYAEANARPEAAPQTETEKENVYER